MKKRILSIMLVFCMVMGMFPANAFAVGSCEHHTSHDDTCGYQAATDPSVCTHQHTADCLACVHTQHDGTCGFVAATDAVACNHGHTAACYTSELKCSHACGDGTCSYSAGTSGSPCDHMCIMSDTGTCMDENEKCTHTCGDGFCSYVAPTDAVACNHQHTDACYTSRLSCNHNCSNSTCSFKEAVSGSDCQHQHTDACYGNCTHLKGQHDSSCGWSAGTAEVPCKFVCSICDHVHSFATEWSSDSSGHWYAATCEHTDEKSGFAAHTPGAAATETTSQTCTECGYVIAPVLEPIPNCICTTKCTASETGVNINTACPVCQNIGAFDGNMDFSVCIGTEPTQHIHVWKDWTSNNNGTHIRTCATDVSHTETVDCTLSDATCEVPATCSACGYTSGEALGHAYGAWKANGNSTHTRTCATDANHIETENCSGGTATCQDLAVCDICKTAYGEKNANNHTGGIEVKNAKEATNTKEGYTGDTCCKGCGVVLKEGSTIKKLPDIPTPTPDTSTLDSGGGSDGSGGGGGGTNTTTETTKNEDGSTTITVTDKKTGATIETTKYPDGSITETTTDAEGNVTCTANISPEAGEILVSDAVEDAAENVVVAPNLPAEATKAEVTLPAETVSGLADNTDASLTVSTPVADVTIPNEALNELASLDDVVTVTAEEAGNTVELTVAAGDTTISEVPGGLNVIVPVEEATSGTVAVLVNEDGTKEIIIKSIPTSENTLIIPLVGSAKVEIVENSKNFEDTQGHWGEEAIDFVSSREFFNGTSHTTFTPEGFMTRGMMAQALHNLEGNPAHDFESSFPDVTDAHWAADAAQWAAENGYINGYPNGEFGMDDNITRQDLLVILWRYFGSPESSQPLNHFADFDQIADDAQGALAWGVEIGLIDGKGDGCLDPGGNAKRVELATIFMRAIEGPMQQQ